MRCTLRSFIGAFNELRRKGVSSECEMERGRFKRSSRSGAGRGGAGRGRGCCSLPVGAEMLPEDKKGSPRSGMSLTCCVVLGQPMWGTAVTWSAVFSRMPRSGEVVIVSAGRD